MNTKNYEGLVLIAASLLAAAWLIAGDEVLQGFSLPQKLIDILVSAPAMIMLLWIISGKKSFMRCEYRAWKRLIGK